MNSIGSIESIMFDLVNKSVKGRIQSARKGQMTFDLAIAIVIIMLIVYTGLNIITLTINRTNERLSVLTDYNKLLMIADNIVKHGKKVQVGLDKIVYHHIVDQGSYDVNYFENAYDMELEIKLCEIYADCQPDKDEMICLTRIVIEETGLGMEPRKLLVCGK